MVAKPFTNGDIMEKLGNIEARLVAVQAQAEKTNGRVTRTEEFINAIKAVDAYKLANPPAPQSQQVIHADTVNVKSPPWYTDQRLLGGVVTILVVVLTIIGYFAQGKH